MILIAPVWNGKGGDGRLEGWKDGRLEGWKGGGLEGWWKSVLIAPVYCLNRDF